jgi:hypothetical protein
VVASATESTVEKATFDEALPAGRDVVWSSQGGVFEESVVLPDASAGPSYPLTLDLPAGVTAQQAGTGVQRLSAKGGLHGTVAGGTAFDSASPRAEAPVSVALVGKQASRAVSLSVSVDEKWLSDPARVFPVTIVGRKTYSLAEGDTVSLRIAGAAYGGGNRGTLVWTAGVDCEI